MSDIPLLEPRVLNGVIQRMPPADGLLGLQLVGRRPWPDPIWEYDIQMRRRNMARPNSPNSPAMMIDQGGVGTLRGGFIYTREKKVFNPTTVRWLRRPGTMNTYNAEQAVLEEFQDLTARVDRFEEWLVWKMIGEGSFDLTNHGHDVQIDYGIDATHKPTVSPLWSASGADPQKDMQDFKRIISRASDASLDRFIGNSNTLAQFYRQSDINSVFSDAQKGAMVSEGVLPRYQGISFTEYDRGYIDDFTDASDPTFKPYIRDGYFVGIANGGPETFRVLQGPSADHDAPPGNTGRFTKTWEQPDPSSRQVLLEANFFPVLYQPDHLIIPKVF